MEQHLTVSPRAFIGAVAGLIAVVAFIFTAIPINIPSRDLPGMTAECGAALDGQHFNLEEDAAACSDLRGTRLAWTLPLVGVGLIGLAGVALIRRPDRHDESAPSRDERERARQGDEGERASDAGQDTRR